MKSIKLGDSSRVRAGEVVMALGSPKNLDNTVTSGIVSNSKRDAADIGIKNGITYIQTDSILTVKNHTYIYHLF